MSFSSKIQHRFDMSMLWTFLGLGIKPCNLFQFHCLQCMSPMVNMDMVDIDMADIDVVDMDMDIFQRCIFFRDEYFSGVNIFGGWIFFRGLYFSGVNIFKGWIYFWEYFSGVTSFQGWISFRGEHFSGVNIWVLHSLLGLVPSPNGPDSRTLVLFCLGWQIFFMFT